MSEILDCLVGSLLAEKMHKRSRNNKGIKNNQFIKGRGEILRKEQIKINKMDPAIRAELLELGFE